MLSIAQTACDLLEKGERFVLATMNMICGG